MNNIIKGIGLRVIMHFAVTYVTLRDIVISLFTMLLGLRYAPLHTPYFIIFIIERVIILPAALIMVWVNTDKVESIMDFSFVLADINKIGINDE